jgi:hypothetical protein
MLKIGGINLKFIDPIDQEKLSLLNFNARVFLLKYNIMKNLKLLKWYSV